MKKYFIILINLYLSILALGQKTDKNLPKNEKLQNRLKSIKENNKINADSAWAILSNLNEYPKIEKTGKEFIFFYNDSVFGRVPVRIFIPSSYSNKTQFPLVLLLHGAVGISRFSNVDTVTMTYKFEGIDYTYDIFIDYLKQQNFIVVRPIADPTKKFNWVVNSFRPSPNPTFNTLTSIITTVKGFLNIDDSKVYAFGHSDGSDGVFGLDIYQPSLFAGFVGYNSMLSQIRGEVYVRNMSNKPFYLVHSDLDSLRPIQQTRLQIKTLDSIKAPILYKEYIGYQHEDKHLQIDKPYSLTFLNSISRNPFSKEVYWETDNILFNTCNWLRIISLDTLAQKAGWHNELNWKLYNRRTKEFMDEPYYRNKNKSGAVIAKYNNNHFTLETSGVGKIELLISPFMVNLQNPVIVTVNGKEIFNKKISADKSFLLENFKKNFDRQALWVTSVNLVVE
jgi:predicted esterase